MVLPLLVSKQSGESVENCTIEILHKEKGKTYLAKAEKQELLLPLPTGSYEALQLECESKAWPLDFSSLPFWRVYEGKIALAAPLELQIMDSIGNIRIVPRGMRIASKSLAQLAQKFTAKHQELFVSAYTGKSIPKKILGTYTSPSLKVYSGKKQIPVGDLPPPPSPAFCFQEEKKINSLFLGTLQITADFKANKKGQTSFGQVSVGKSPHTYSDAFVNCIQQLFTNYKNSSQKKLSYQIAL